MQNIGDSIKVGTAGDRACVNSWVTLAGACGRFEIQVGKTSIGADISVFSQFEAEKEYLYAPLTHLQLLGQPRLEDHNGKQLSVLSMQLTGKGRKGLVCKKKGTYTYICSRADVLYRNKQASLSLSAFLQLFLTLLGLCHPWVCVVNQRSKTVEQAERSRHDFLQQLAFNLEWDVGCVFMPCRVLASLALIINSLKNGTTQSLCGGSLHVLHGS